MNKPEPDGPTLEAQITCVKREIGMRKRVYPAWVHAKRMNVFKAEEEIALMTAVLKTLEELQGRGGK